MRPEWSSVTAGTRNAWLFPIPAVLDCDAVTVVRRSLSKIAW